MGIGDIIIIAVLALVLLFAVRSVIKRRKSGGCGCGCEGCTMKCEKKNSRS